MNYSAVFDMIKEMNIHANPLEDLSIDQTDAYNKLKDGYNMCVIGPAGCGKSFLINKFKDFECNDKIIYLTSTTGISAYNIGGMTINAFIGYGSGDASADVLLKKVRRNKDACTRISMVDTLVIDEASMMSADLFEKTEYILRTIRKSMVPFGGIQIILSMDPYQLCPVFTGGNSQDTRLLVESTLFINFFIKSKMFCILDKNFRQLTDNTNFVDTLLRIRTGNHTDSDIDFISKRIIKSPEGVTPVRVVVSNKKAEQINHTELAKLTSVKYTYKSHYGGHTELKNELEHQFKSRQQDTVTLTIGARVMLTKNLNVEGGLVNGAIGVITQFKYDTMTREHYPVVKFDNGTTSLITRKEFELVTPTQRANAKQLPLILAWAFTVHKLQSCTVDYLEADLEDVFCDGQVYVALSRVKNYKNLYLKSFNKNKIFVNKSVKNFFENVIYSTRKTSSVN